MINSNVGAAVRVENLTQTFGGLVAVNQLSLDIQAGELFGVIGPNGAGKTTVLNCISQVNRRYSGKIFVDDELLSGDPARIVDRGVLRTFQSPDFFAGFEAMDFLQLGCLGRQRKSVIASAAWLPIVRRDELREREVIYEVLERYGLSSVIGKMVRDLPYGLRKTLDLLRTVVANPRVLLLDEPTSGVAAADRMMIAGIIKDINKRGTTVVVVDHDVRFITDLTHRVLAMNYGRELAVGVPAEVLAVPEVVESYLGYKPADSD